MSTVQVAFATLAHLVVECTLAVILMYTLGAGEVSTDRWSDITEGRQA